MANQYFTCVLDAWASGATIYARMHYYRADGLTYTYQDSSFPVPTMIIAGTAYSDTAFANRVRSGLGIGNVYTTEFTKTVGTNGSYSVSFSAGSGARSDFAGTWSTSVNVTGAATAPSAPTVTIAEIYDTGAKFNVSLASYGSPSSASGRWIEAGIAAQNSWVSPSLRSAIVKNVSSASITVNNFSTKTQTLTVKPNTKYYYGGYAWNTQLGNSTISGQFVTKASAPTIVPGIISTDSATFSYFTNSDGGYYNKTIEYSIDDGTTWTTAATVTGGAASSGTFTISNLTAGTRYNLQTRVSTTSGITNGTEISFIAKSGLVTAFYTSSNNQSVKVTDLYGSVNGASQRISKLYSEVNGQTKLIYQGFGHAPSS